MTEKKSEFLEDSGLSPEDQQQLLSEENYFKQSFSSFACPPLPESLRAENIWNKICSSEGDNQVTVDVSLIEKQLQDLKTTESVFEGNTELSSKPIGECLEFPTETKKEGKVISLTQRRRRWAIACTLVLAVGLSAAYWKMKAPIEKMDSLVEAPSANILEQDMPTKTMDQEAAEESVEVVPDTASAPQTFSAPVPEEPEENAQVEESAVDVPQAASIAPEEEVAQQVQQEEQTTEEPPMIQPRVSMPESVENDEKASSGSRKEKLQQKILSSLQPDEAVSEEIQTQENQVQVLSEEATNEETVEEEESLLTGAVKSARQNRPQTYSLKNGSISYDPVSGTMILQNMKGEEVSSLAFSANAKIFAGDKSVAVIEENAQDNMVSLTVYSLEEIENPQEVSHIVHQGELFDSYQSKGDSYTLVTSVWFTQEQIASGEFLPQINGEEVSADKVNIIEGYGGSSEVNYHLTTTVTLDSVKTRADLYLN